MTFSLLILGGGVAGSSLAYHAARAGLDVTLIDAGREAASSVPSALINPVRGQNGHLVDRGLEGMRFTWALVDTLERAGYSVPQGRSGVLRPVPDQKTFEKWRSRLPEDLPHRWLEGEAVPSGAHLQAHWHKVLEVSEGGWLEGAALLRALRSASGVRVLRAVATGWDAHSATLEDGTHLEADAVAWCGGSWGTGMGQARSGPENSAHRRGSVVLLERPLSEVPVSFGIYGAPAARGGVLGATYETPTTHWTGGGLPLKSLEWLVSRAAQTFTALEPEVRGLWTGTRLGGELRFGQGEDGVYQLSALGSKGFLLGPLLASDLLERILD